MCISSTIDNVSLYGYETNKPHLFYPSFAPPREMADLQVLVKLSIGLIGRVKHDEEKIWVS